MKSKYLNKLLSIALITTIIPLSTPTYQKVSAETIPVQNPEDQPVPLTGPLTTTSTSLKLTATKGGEKVDLQIDDKPEGSNSGVAQVKVEGKDTSESEENQTIPITLLDVEGNPVEGADKSIIEGTPASDGLINQKETSMVTGFKVTQNGDYTITTIDGANNKSTKNLRISHIFKKEPTVNINTSIPTSPTNKPLGVKLTATPEAWSGYQAGDIQNKIKSATISQIEYTAEGEDSQTQKRNKAEPLTTVPVKLTPSTTDTSGGSIPSTIEFTAPHSADYTLTITDDAGNTTTELIKINHIDLRGPSTDETANATALNPLKTWTKAPNQEFLLKFKSPSNTAFSLVPSDPVEEGVTYELIYNGFTEPTEGQTKGIAIVKATVVENGTYNLKLKDAIGEVSQEIAVTNFDRSGPEITISSDTSNLNPLLYGETGTSTSEMPIEQQ